MITEKVNLRTTQTRFGKWVAVVTAAGDPGGFTSLIKTLLLNFIQMKLLLSGEAPEPERPEQNGILGHQLQNIVDLLGSVVLSCSNKR